MGVSRVYKRSSEGVSRKFKMNFKEGCIKNASSVFQGNEVLFYNFVVAWQSLHTCKVAREVLDLNRRICSHCSLQLLLLLVL